MKTENEDKNEKLHSSLQRTKSVESVSSIRNNATRLWRSTSLLNIAHYSRTRRNSSILCSQKSRNSSDAFDASLDKNNSNYSTLNFMSRKWKNKLFGNSNSFVTVVLVEAKGLPPVPEDGVKHSLFCKFRLGPESYKTKAVPSTVQPEWGERFLMRVQTDNSLKVSVWERGKQKNFMGSCVLDLSVLERERTHDIWQQLEDGYGLIHFSITICLSSFDNSSLTRISNLEDVEQRQNIHNLRSNWELVGSLHVNIYGARGLVGKPNAYCILELENQRVQTPKEGASSEPIWNKYYIFSVYDVTSTLDLKVYDKSLTSAFLNEPIGKVSIPLLTIANGEEKWYALKDKNRRNIARGNCPRVRLQMTLIWNPIKASVRIFRPKSVKHVKKAKKYDIALVYSNIKFVEKLFNFLREVNESLKQVFEWDDRETSLIALITWLVFCFYFRLWMLPLCLLLPFIYYWFCNRYQDNKLYTPGTYSYPVEGVTKTYNKEAKSLSGNLQDMQVTTLVVTSGVEYIASVAERLYNLISIKVPFLSYLMMILLAIGAVVLYLIPFNYLMMILGIYKFTRKYLNPDRVLNNDLLDFLSRIPDNGILKDWKELSVPEPSSDKLARSISAGVPPHTITTPVQ